MVSVGIRNTSIMGLKNLKKHAGVFKWLKNAKPNKIKTFIKSADNKFIKTVCECSLNVLRGNVPISNKHKQSLKKYKKDLRHLANKKVSLNQKKKLLLKKRGYNIIAGLAKFLIPLVGSIFGF